MAAEENNKTLNCLNWQLSSTNMMSGIKILKNYPFVCHSTRNTDLSCENIEYLYNNQINAHALIGQSAMVYCASKLKEK